MVLGGCGFPVDFFLAAGSLEPVTDAWCTVETKRGKNRPHRVECLICQGSGKTPRAARADGTLVFGACGVCGGVGSVPVGPVLVGGLPALPRSLATPDAIRSRPRAA